MSKCYARKRGLLWGRAKRSDRSEGAASEVRRIDPTMYQPREEVRQILRPPPAPKQTLALLKQADELLLRDVRGHSKRYRAKVRNRIVTGRY